MWNLGFGGGHATRGGGGSRSEGGNDAFFKCVVGAMDRVHPMRETPMVVASDDSRVCPVVIELSWSRLVRNGTVFAPPHGVEGRVRVFDLRRGGHALFHSLTSLHGMLRRVARSLELGGVFVTEVVDDDVTNAAIPALKRVARDAVARIKPYRAAREELRAVAAWTHADGHTRSQMGVAVRNLTTSLYGRSGSVRTCKRSDHTYTKFYLGNVHALRTEANRYGLRLVFAAPSSLLQLGCVTCVFALVCNTCDNVALREIVTDNRNPAYAAATAPKHPTDAIGVAIRAIRGQ